MRMGTAMVKQAKKTVEEGKQNSVNMEKSTADGLVYTVTGRIGNAWPSVSRHGNESLTTLKICTMQAALRSTAL